MLFYFSLIWREKSSNFFFFFFFFVFPTSFYCFITALFLLSNHSISPQGIQLPTIMQYKNYAMLVEKAGKMTKISSLNWRKIARVQMRRSAGWHAHLLRLPLALALSLFIALSHSLSLLANWQTSPQYRLPKWMDSQTTTSKVGRFIITLVAMTASRSTSKSLLVVSVGSSP